MSISPSKRGKTPRKKNANVDYGALAGSVGFLLRRVQLAVLGDLIKTLAPLDLRPAQFSVLAVISANADLAQSDLCAALSIQRANFVAMLDELESRGLAQRCVSTRDRRVNTVTLTAEGRSLLRRAVEVHAAHEAKLLKQLGTKGRSQFASLLAKLMG